MYAGFYKGRIAKAIVAALDEEKGVLAADDLEQHRSTITRPIHTTYRGHTIYEVPPPTQAKPLRTLFMQMKQRHREYSCCHLLAGACRHTHRILSLFSRWC